MNLVDTRDLVAFSAVVTTILQFLSGILVCKQYVVHRTTAESSPLPFICGFLSCGVWLLYGLIKQDNVVALVNVVGFLLMISYVLIFYIYTFKKASLLKQFLSSLVLYAFVMGYVSIETDNEILLSRVGLSACVLTLLTIASPMSKLLYVIRTKCTDCLPFPMIVMSFIVSSLWFFYGLIEQDVYMIEQINRSLQISPTSIYNVTISDMEDILETHRKAALKKRISNAIGGGLTVVQLSLFKIYPATPYPSLTSKIIA